MKRYTVYAFDIDLCDTVSEIFETDSLEEARETAIKLAKKYQFTVDTYDDISGSIVGVIDDNDKAYTKEWAIERFGFINKCELIDFIGKDNANIAKYTKIEEKQ